jgi:hypothetical protein
VGGVPPCKDEREIVAQSSPSSSCNEHQVQMDEKKKQKKHDVEIKLMWNDIRQFFLISFSQELHS